LSSVSENDDHRGMQIHKEHIWKSKSLLSCCLKS